VDVMSNMNFPARFSLLAIYFLVTMILMGCSANPATLVTAAPSPATLATSSEELEFETYFQGLTGAFVLYDQNSDLYIRYNPEQCSRRFLPASTFKIMNAMIGLETGVIADENYVIKWDRTQYDLPGWNQDHTLKTAMQNSVVWYYQELARQVGKERIQYYMDAVKYGNQDADGADPFWLNGALKISADEQVEFLRRLYHGDLPFSQRSMEIVKEILLLEATDAYQLSGKTGSGQIDALYIGWFVGFLEQADNVYFFAANIQGANAEAKGPKAKEIVLSILREYELIP
jgi:beta-lactamase class D